MNKSLILFASWVWWPCITFFPQKVRSNVDPLESKISQRGTNLYQIWVKEFQLEGPIERCARSSNDDLLSELRSSRLRIASHGENTGNAGAVFRHLLDHFSGLFKGVNHFNIKFCYLRPNDFYSLYCINHQNLYLLSELVGRWKNERLRMFLGWIDFAQHRDYECRRLPRAALTL